MSRRCPLVLLASWLYLSGGVEAQQAPAPLRIQLEEPEDLAWDSRWTRFNWSHVAVTSSLVAGILATHTLAGEPRSARVQGELPLDGAFRYNFRASSAGTRNMAASVSDALLYSLLAWPTIDAGLALTAHDSPDAAAQILGINAQSFALTYLVVAITKNAVRRERPFGQECDSPLGESDPRCSGPNRYESFMSGHTAMAFTAAGLVCSHHQSLPLYGGGAGDRAACYTAMGAATAVGALRMAADRHYLSDVVFGAGLGLISGMLLPQWLHYDLGPSDPLTGQGRLGTVSPMASSDSVGLGYHRIFW